MLEMYMLCTILNSRNNENTFLLTCFEERYYGSAFFLFGENNRFEMEKSIETKD